MAKSHFSGQEKKPHSINTWKYSFFAVLYNVLRFIIWIRWYTSGASQVKQTAIPFQCGEDKKREVTIDKIKRKTIHNLFSSSFKSKTN